MIKKINIKKILIIHTAFPGDIILATPLIQAARLTFPDAGIDFLTIPICANIIETNPDLNRVILFDKHSEYKGLRKLLKLATQLKKENYDLAVIPHRSLRSAVLAYAAKIPQRIGFDTSAGSFLFTQKVKYHSEIHEVERNLRLLSVFKPDLPTFLPRVFPSAADQSVVDSYFKKNQIEGKKQFCAIAPGSVWETKKWPKEYFARLCDLIDATFKMPVFLIGGQPDFDLGEWIARYTSARTINTAGKLSFRQSAELICRCRFLVTNDSAPLHLGVAVQTPVFAIFGPTVPGFGFAPLGEQHHVFEKEIYCRPCGIHGGRKCPTGTFYCMKSIKPDEVISELKDKFKF